MRRTALSDLQQALARTTGRHQQALSWFATHSGETVPWTVLKEHGETGPYLVTQAKGIYKPEYMDYALSVRQTIGGPYPDKEVIRRADGSWIYPYFQENADPSKRDEEATNRGLMACMRDRVPVGVLIQTKPKPGVEYQVLGLAAVTAWESGYFILEGYSNEGNLTPEKNEDASRDRAKIVARGAAQDSFRPDKVEDQRERQIAEVVRRRGQAKFRAALLAAYAGRCCATECDAVEALEAAHISPYRGEGSHHAQNGLLLRADIHSLFDLGLIGVDPESMRWIVGPALKGTSYMALNNRDLLLPAEVELQPSAEALRQHLSWSGLKS